MPFGTKLVNNLSIKEATMSKQWWQNSGYLNR